MEGRRYTDQRDLVIRIARVATKLLPRELGGIDLRFINDPTLYQNQDSNSVAGALGSLYGGSTNIGTNLRAKVLDDLVYKVISTGATFKRPLLVCTITDGSPYPENMETFKEAIVECKNKLVAANYDPTSVMFLISQIGNDESAGAFLSSLRNDTWIKDVIHVTTDQLDAKFRELKENERKLEVWLLELLTKPIMSETT